MDSSIRTSIWQQFGASIDMLDNAMNACPDELWRYRLWEDPSERPEYSEFWYRVYHTLFWLDLYLTGVEEGFAPPAPFTRIEADDDLPDRPYTKAELQSYLDYARSKCQATIEALTDEKASQHCTFGWGNVNFLELQLYSMRHVQEHAAQLSLLLGQKGVSAPDWVTKAKGKADYY